MCEHVYKYVFERICSKCNSDTHEPDWELLKAQRKAHREQFGLLYTVREWWSI